MYLERTRCPCGPYWEYPLQRALVREVSISAEKAGRPELLPLWAGQSANLSRGTEVRTLLDTLVKELSEIGGAVRSWSAHRRRENVQE
jgi:nitronate monooxygenase